MLIHINAIKTKQTNKWIKTSSCRDQNQTLKHQTDTIAVLCVLRWVQHWEIYKKNNHVVPAVLGRRRTSGSLEPLRIPADRWKAVHPACGSGLWFLPRTTSHLRERKWDKKTETCTQRRSLRRTDDIRSDGLLFQIITA